MNKQQLIEKREQVEKDKDQHLADLNGCLGAINVLNQLIADEQKTTALQSLYNQGYEQGKAIFTLKYPQFKSKK